MSLAAAHSASAEPAPCAQCGARPVNGFTSCKQMYETVLEREYTLSAYGAVHLLTVDSYALTHGTNYSSRSNAYHLVSLCRQLERGVSSAIGTHAGTRTAPAFERLYRSLPHIVPPSRMSELTIASVVQARDGREHRVRVLDWANSVYLAWEHHHAWARQMSDRFDALRTATV